MFKNKFDIVVIGGGHAGVEAALISSFLGSSVAIITMDTNAIARMSCNPAIGGLAKGQIVREIDVLGGAMAKITDLSGLQFKTLNKSKGRAVWSPRAQVDKRLYEKNILVIYVNFQFIICPNFDITFIWPFNEVNINNEIIPLSFYIFCI